MREKARAICGLYSQNLPKQQAKSKADDEPAIGNLGPDEKMAHLSLTKEQVRCILSIFVNISLTLLPIYASDYPPQDRRKYYKFLMQWTRRSGAVIDHFMGLITHDSIKMLKFISACEEHNVFNVQGIRDVAKRTSVVHGDSGNPNLAKDSMSERELFAGRLSQEELNDDLEEDLADVPSIFAEAVLYKVVQTIESQMNQSSSSRFNRRDARQYLKDQEVKLSGRSG